MAARPLSNARLGAMIVINSLAAPAATTRTILLDRRTLHRSERTENAAITCFWTQHTVAMGAFVKIHAGVRRHLFGSRGPACGACHYGRQFSYGLLHQYQRRTVELTGAREKRDPRSGRWSFTHPLERLIRQRAQDVTHRYRTRPV